MHLFPEDGCARYLGRQGSGCLVAQPAPPRGATETQTLGLKFCETECGLWRELFLVHSSSSKAAPGAPT